MSEQRNSASWANVALVALVALIWIASMVIGGMQAGDDEESFGGTDGYPSERAEELGREPWFEPVFEPAPEVESGLFALQAALGAGVLGFALGRIGRDGSRRRASDLPVSAPEPAAEIKA